SSRRRHTRCLSDWSSDVCSSDLFGLRVYELLYCPTDDYVSRRFIGWVLMVTVWIFFALTCGLIWGSVVSRVRAIERARALKDVRSEERRVGKGGRCGWWRLGDKE